ncbi:MAG: phytanoyl-CoA dioxygenase family protein [Balneolaceae bacterium]|nr:phytanoyl-CoA dioxygenase family protein [Balneolaceae bacterium]MBO6546423.1 phytanoyl-CoA dioxygenase family protein [Balneolaceae bacterium]MBO6648782.1 phytanoyl-CoA dioxygenase family protein [Balneolaceae bacterium]
MTTSDLHIFTESEIKSYKENGYLLPVKNLLSDDKQTLLTELFEEHLANRGGKKSDELDTPHFSDQRLLDILLAPEVLDAVEDIIGPNIGLFSSHFISKEPGKGRRTPWHEDSAYWEGKFDELDKIVTIWLAIDNSTKENGCMGVVPGTHNNGFSEYEGVQDKENSTFTTEIKKGTFDLDDVVWFELKKGQYSMHDARIIHGANANTSSTRRCGYTMRYFSLDMKFNQESAPNHKLYHARGENVASNPLVYYKGA